MKKNGFTLIEILVVISIIAILGALSFGIFSTVQKNNRDQIRIRDLQSIKQALELYRSDLGDYPSANDENNDFMIDGLEKYLTSWPVDPKNGQYYTYAKLATGKFVVCAKKEGTMTETTLADCLSINCDASNKCDIGLQSD